MTSKYYLLKITGNLTGGTIFSHKYELSYNQSQAADENLHYQKHRIGFRAFHCPLSLK